jgi:hypothetical protein
MSDRKIIVLRPNLPLRSAQLRTKKIAAQQGVFRELSSKLRELRTQGQSRQANKLITINSSSKGGE